MTRSATLPLGAPRARPWARWRPVRVTATCSVCSWRRYTYTAEQARKEARQHADAARHPVTLERVSTRVVYPRQSPALEAPR